MMMLLKIIFFGKNKEKNLNTKVVRKTFESCYFFIFLLKVFENILQSVDTTSKLLQSPNIDMSSASQLFHTALRKPGRIKKQF
jgi:hypothetical protein